MRLLFIAMPGSIHTARWIGQLHGRGWDIHLFPTSGDRPHPMLTGVTVHDRRGSRLERLLTPGEHWPMHARGMSRLHRMLMDWPWRNRAWRLARLIRRLRPDIVHSLEMQRAGYLTRDAQRLMPKGFPPWIVSNWGSDVVLFGRLAAHVDRVRGVLSACDYYTCECRRDVMLARVFGFKGIALPVVPISGGFDVEGLSRLRQPGPTSQRRLVLLKGYQGWAGRALFGLRALELAADALRGYRVGVYLAGSEEVRIAAELLGQTAGVDVELLPFGSHEDMMRLYGQARVVIGLSISDGCSHSLLEGMIMGAFPIQSGTACTQEWFRDGEGGLAVHPEDPEGIARAIRRALTDDALVDRAAAINAEMARTRLDHAVIRPQVLGMYERILAEREARAAGDAPNPQ